MVQISSKRTALTGLIAGLTAAFGFGLPALAGTAAAQPSAPDETIDIYITEGVHNVNGREWRTACEPYSQTARCRTEIKAYVVNVVDGEYVKTYDWAFNNLTYAAAPRALWEGNPLAGHAPQGHWVSADGRRWSTDCSGHFGNACRAYIWTSFIEAYETPAGYRYRPAQGWVFNNIVRFTDAAPEPDGSIDLYET